MNRCLAFLLSLLFASLSVASACTAATGDWVQFTLKPGRNAGEIHASFRDQSRGRGDSNWSTSFSSSQLAGFDANGFRLPGQRPLRFALIREAGRLDCAGSGGDSYASGNCRFTADPAFLELLESRGIGRPTRDEAFGLMAVDARREIIEAVAAARYPTPSIGDLMALSALGVRGDYIRAMAETGYRPNSIDGLVQFKALDITPDYVAGFARIGYARIEPDELVQLKALDVTPDYVAAFQRLGYASIDADDLVQLKALGVTADYVAGLQRAGYPQLPVDKLVQMKALGITPELARALPR